jgi:hypothetical protein
MPELICLMMACNFPHNETSMLLIRGYSEQEKKYWV